MAGIVTGERAGAGQHPLQPPGGNARLQETEAPWTLLAKQVPSTQFLETLYISDKLHSGASTVKSLATGAIEVRCPLSRSNHGMDQDKNHGKEEEQARPGISVSCLKK